MAQGARASNDEACGRKRPAEGATIVMGVLVSDFSMARPPSVDIPAMIVPPEMNYYFWLTSNLPPDHAAVVEFGTWLGASTVYLSAGLGGRPMHCYDHFRWFGYDNWKSAVKLEDGADFFPLFSSNVARYGANVVAHRATFDEARWSGEPIELLVLDAPKQADEVATLLNVFAPSFITGKTLLVLEDYQHFPSYQIAVVMDALGASVALEHVVVATDNRQPNAVGLRIAAPVPLKAATAAAEGIGSRSVEQVRAAWGRIMAPLPEQARARMAPGLALFLHDAGHRQEAAEALAQTPMDRIMLNRWRRLCGESTPYFDFPDRYRSLVTLMRERLAEARPAEVSA